MRDLEYLIKEQNRLVDAVSNEPSIVTDNIINNLQNNMANIAEQIIELYGTNETEEERAEHRPSAYMPSITLDSEGVDFQIHDDMDLSLLADTAQISQADKTNKTDNNSLVKTNQLQIKPVDGQILEAFLEESAELLNSANEHFLECQNDISNRTSIRELRRNFHTLKAVPKQLGMIVSEN